MNPKEVNEIPLLPIQAFKEKEIITNFDSSASGVNKLTFLSSGTSGMEQSKHIVTEPELYKESIFRGFDHFYNSDELVIWAYTPGYDQNPNSSLIWMLNALISRDDSGLSRFLNLNSPLIQQEIDNISENGKRLMLFGAAFGLLDLSEISNVQMSSDTIIMETGGMKTYRREMSKPELHSTLSKGFGLSITNVHSEYGMTELLSQAYSKGGIDFQSVPWLDISIRNPDNPFEVLEEGEEGLIGVMDLSNINSCSFIVTGDKGIKNPDGSFQVLGRWSPVNLRGCNFLIDQD